MRIAVPNRGTQDRRREQTTRHLPLCDPASWRGNAIPFQHNRCGHECGKSGAVTTQRTHRFRIRIEWQQPLVMQMMKQAQLANDSPEAIETKRTIERW